MYIAFLLISMSSWLPLVFILSIGFAVAMNVLAPHYRVEHSPGALRLPVDGYTMDLSAGGPFFAPFWAIYGFVEPGALGNPAPSVSNARRAVQHSRIPLVRSPLFHTLASPTLSPLLPSSTTY